jgi:hypothetical protein
LKGVFIPIEVKVKAEAEVKAEVKAEVEAKEGAILYATFRKVLQVPGS